MKKVVLMTLMLLLLTGCGMLDRGNYDKNRTGYVQSGDLIVSYHTNSIGEIDIFMIDQIMTFFEALDYTEFDAETLGDHPTISSYVTPEELTSCGVDRDTSIPRFIRIEYDTYYYNVRENGYCTYDEYKFHKRGFSDNIVLNPDTVSPVENLNITLFKTPNFTINTFEKIIYIEEIYYDDNNDEWEKDIVSVMPMSYRQAGNLYEDFTSFMEQISIIELYVLENQSINLLVLREDYTSEEVNNIWSEDTIASLGRNHNVIKTVRLDQTQDILDVIHDTLTRLGMFS